MSSAASQSTSSSTSSHLPQPPPTFDVQDFSIPTLVEEDVDANQQCNLKGNFITINRQKSNVSEI